MEGDVSPETPHQGTASDHVNPTEHECDVEHSLLHIVNIPGPPFNDHNKDIKVEPDFEAEKPTGGVHSDQVTVTSMTSGKQILSHTPGFLQQSADTRHMKEEMPDEQKSISEEVTLCHSLINSPGLKEEGKYDDVTEVHLESKVEDEYPHSEDESGSFQFRCAHTNCCKVFKNRKQLLKHSRYHGYRTYREVKCNPHECPICGKSCAAIPALRIHMRRHTGERPYKCDNCDKEFTCSSHLWGHKKRFHLKSTGQYTCSFCNRIFFQNCDLTKHVRTHTGEKPYKCDICDKRFGQSAHLASHIKCHTGDKPHKCETCGKAFMRGTHLRQHQMTHFETEKKYKCGTCDKMFATRAILKQHSSVHTDETYPCEVCGKTFMVRSYLIQHGRVHMDRKACDVCGKKYSTKKHLLLHMKVHSDT